MEESLLTDGGSTSTGIAICESKNFGPTLSTLDLTIPFIIPEYAIGHLCYDL